MQITQFRVENNRSIRLAECQNLPWVMIVTGPNGCGKSTLLQALRPVAGGVRPMYIGPHRASRRQKVRFRFLGPEIRMRSVLEGDTLPGYEGIRDVSRPRNPWDQDDAASFVKYGLSQIELDRREAIAARYDQAAEIKKDSLPDVWKPLREMAENLLPHLVFERIDTRNKDEIQCLWRVSGRATVVDLDDLSSGEKSIIHLFYPLIEHRIRRILAKLRGKTDALDAEPVCVLIDEPNCISTPTFRVRCLITYEGSQFESTLSSSSRLIRRRSSRIPIAMNSIFWRPQRMCPTATTNSLG